MTRPLEFRLAALAIAGPALLAPTAGAQCSASPAHVDLSTLPGAGTLIDDMVLWDPDGAGPLPGQLTVCGAFQGVAGAAAQGVATLDPTTGTWSGIGAPPWFSLFEVVSVAGGPGGELAVGVQTGFNTGQVYRWDGAAWTSIGAVSGSFSSAGSVASLLYLPGGDLVAGGAFTTISGVAANNVARWDGAGWSALGPGINGTVRNLALDAVGDLVAGSVFNTPGGVNSTGLTAWDGSSWAPIAVGTAGLSFEILDFELLDAGRIAAGGLFFFPASGTQSTVAIWDGNDWTLPGGGLGEPVTSVTELPGGDLLFGGDLTVAGGVAIEDLARWNGSAWSTLGPGVGSNPGDQVLDLFTTLGGSVWIGGFFPFSPTDPTGGLATVDSSCPATATTIGTGGAGSLGPTALSTSDQPWLGTTFTATASGFDGGALLLSLVGFTPTALPLSTVTPAATPGSSLYTDPDPSLITALVNNGGSTTLALPLPLAPALAGVIVRAQVLGVEVGPGGPLDFLVTTTNGLELTLGLL